MVNPTETDDGTTQTVTIELETCYYPFFPNDPKENTVSLNTSCEHHSLKQLNAILQMNYFHELHTIICFPKTGFPKGLAFQR